MKTTTTLASNQDFAAIANIYNEYIREGRSTMEESFYTPEKIQEWVVKFNERERLYVVKDKDLVIGWGIIKRYSDREGYRFACETAIYITNTRLRQGHGSRLKHFLIAECKALDYRHLVAKIFASNTASVEYNLQLGYTTVGIQREIGYKNGQWMDIVIMQYLIS
jgi:phosphinothricin acetyltransferase